MFDWVLNTPLKCVYSFILMKNMVRAWNYNSFMVRVKDRKMRQYEMPSFTLSFCNSQNVPIF